MSCCPLLCEYGSRVCGGRSLSDRCRVDAGEQFGWFVDLGDRPDTDPYRGDGRDLLAGHENVQSSRDPAKRGNEDPADRAVPE